MLDNIKAIIFDFDGTLYDFKGLPKNLCLSSIPNMLKISAVQKTRKSLKGRDFPSIEEYEKLNKLLCGIREMNELPGAMFIVDPSKEDIAIREAHRLNITMSLRGA